MRSALDGIPGLDVHVWEQASAPSGQSQDAWLVQPRPGALRAVVIDGVSPWRADRRAGVDAAVWAAGVTRLAFTAPEGLRECALAANAELHRGDRSPTAESQACLVAADVDAATGGVRLLRAGDCEAWVRRDGRWAPVLTGDYVLPEARRAVRDWEAAHPGRTLDDLLAAQDALLADLALWRTSSVGRFPAPILEEARVEAGWEALCLASDGARLGEEVLGGDLGAWLDGLREHERRTRGGEAKPHDDVTCMLVTTRG